MRYFYDLEFGRTAPEVTLVSVGVVADDGREFYGVSSEFDPLAVHPWVARHVLPQLPPVSTWRSRTELAAGLEEFFGDEPVWWAWMGAYDHVALCQLWGEMPALPRSFPRMTLDVKQLWVSLGRPALPVQASGLHDALADARHCKARWEAMAERAWQMGVTV